MTQRWIAFAFAAPLTVLLLVLAAFVPLPYSVYSPGPTFDVLAKDGNESEIIQVDGHKTYRDEGEIRFTTVQTSAREDKMPLFEALAAWIDGDKAVIPYDIAHPPDQSAEDERTQGVVSMVGSQDTAIATALRELGFKVPTTLQVAFVNEDGAAFKKLRVRDRIITVDGESIGLDSQKLVDAVESHGPGDPVVLEIERDGKRLTVEIEPKVVDGETRIGIIPGRGYTFPFDVSIQVDSSIGGPSAGLMFSLAVYDTLTPGSLTDGEVVAGTGELADDGSVGPIGGIEQKVAGAEEAGAELFFVPEANCGDVKDLDPDLTLVKATTMPRALEALEAWAEDRDAELPSC